MTDLLLAFAAYQFRVATLEIPSRQYCIILEKHILVAIVMQKTVNESSESAARRAADSACNNVFGI